MLHLIKKEFTNLLECVIFWQLGSLSEEYDFLFEAVEDPEHHFGRTSNIFETDDFFLAHSRKIFLRGISKISQKNDLFFLLSHSTIEVQ